MHHILRIFIAVTLLALVSCRFLSISNKILEQCKNEARLPNGKLTNFGDPKSKCFFHCLFKKMGLVLNGKLVYEKALKIYQGDHPSMDENTKEKLKGCVFDANKNADCDVSVAMVMCMEERLPETSFQG
ncbi:uncharacterized protein LOC106641530 [Copidosoma floridanum]|uniref:uncharacterized protein LOC106641530 n=1 Tax=Copidosoma floridanum TaxID=29053 RepID=UPI0006C9B9EF|nr:uncharacterized protein LOC106641530 [Copidosoma floridanum]